MLKLFRQWLFFLKNPDYVRGGFFWTYGCSPVNSGRCHVVLLTAFCLQMWPHHKRRPQSNGCLPVDSGKCHVVLPTSFCMQMWPHCNCCPRLNTQRCNIRQRFVKATLCLLQKLLHQSHLLLTPADNLANSLGLPGKRSRFGSQGGEILALRHHWAAMRDLPVNSHATHVQHTCNTRATYVQHDVQHEHFYCKFTGKIAFSRLAATNPLCFHLKVRVGLRLPKNNILAANLQ